MTMAEIVWPKVRSPPRRKAFSTCPVRQGASALRWASRLHDAKRKSLLSESQLAELAEIARSSGLMGEIRALGQIPRWRKEYALRRRLHYAKGKSLLGETAQAQRPERMETLMAEIRAIQAQRRAAVSVAAERKLCLLYTSPSPRDVEESRMPSSG